MSPAEIEVVAKRAGKEAVNELLLTLGIDASAPGQVLKLQRDFANLRSWGDSMDMVRSKGLATAVVVIVTSFLGFLFVAIKGH